MVQPKMVYISNPTELGTIYSKEELTVLSDTCHKYGLYLFLDGARLGYGLAAPDNDLTMADIARLCDVFYIGGTKIGALFGEAVVIRKEKKVRELQCGKLLCGRAQCESSCAEKKVRGDRFGKGGKDRNKWDTIR